MALFTTLKLVPWRSATSRGQAARDFVRVQETQALHLLRQKLFRESGLTRAVAAGDDIDRWLGCGHV